MNEHEVLPIERRAFIAEAKDVDTEKRRITHIISNASLDRAGDMIDPAGWDLKDFKRNPVVLINHDYDVRSIIGRSVHIEKTEDGLYSTTEFGDHALGHEAFELVRMGLAKAWSVGFRAMEHHRISDGKDMDCEACKKVRAKNAWVHFLKQTLLEYSLVAIPMNQDIVNNAIQRGVVSKANASLFFKAPDVPAAAALDGANGTRRPKHWQSAEEFFARVARDAEIRRRAEEMK